MRLLAYRPRMRDLPSIFSCEEYTRKRWPPPIETCVVGCQYHMPCLFSFAYTPSGRVSKYRCALAFRYPNPSPDRIERWAADERPALKSGYRWSRVYAYTKYTGPRAD